MILNTLLHRYRPAMAAGTTRNRLIPGAAESDPAQTDENLLGYVGGTEPLPDDAMGLKDERYGLRPAGARRP